MHLVRWNPIRNMFSLRREMNHMLNDFFYPTRKDDQGLSVWNWTPVVDIFDNDDTIVIKAELPGVDKEDIVVDVDGRYLTLKGERSSESEVKEESYHRRESAYGKFERVFTLPAEVDPDKIVADYKDGILKISVPKPEEKKPKQITVH